jgi:hypothetical protein
VTRVHTASRFAHRLSLKLGGTAGDENVVTAARDALKAQDAMFLSFSFT